MTKYALVDSNGSILREINTDTKPGDPVGKGWYWMTVSETVPTLAEGEELSPPSKTVDMETKQVIVTFDKVDSKVTKADINSERDRRLNKKTVIKLTDVGDVTVRLNSEYLNSIQSLAMSAMIKVMKNEAGISYTFRDEENINWSLTANQVLDLFLAIELELRDVLEASWLIKDDVEPPDTYKELKRDPRWP